MTFTAIVVSHGSEWRLRHILGQLRYQTTPPDETLVFYSGEGYDSIALADDFPEATWLPRPNMEDWGHEKRAEGVQLALGDWLGFFNDDDEYAPHYIERMMSRASGYSDAVYCWWNERPEGCSFQAGSSTSGNFIVRTEVARLAGYNSRTYEADGHFIERVNSVGREIFELKENLYTHNALHGRDE